MKEALMEAIKQNAVWKNVVYLATTDRPEKKLGKPLTICETNKLIFNYGNN